METVISLFETAVQRFARSPALIALGRDEARTWTYADLWEQSGRMAVYLREQGVTPGDRVVLWGANHPHWVVAFLGITRLGACVVPLDATGTVEFAEQVCTQVEARLALVDGVAGTRDTLAGVPCPRLDEQEAWLASQPALTDEPIVTAEMLCEIVFTSGSTGTPKGVMLTHGNLTSNVQAVATWMPTRPTDRALSILPLSHVLEQTTGLLLPLQGGACVIYPASRASVDLFKALREYRVTAMVVVPRVLQLFKDGIEREVARQGRAGQWRVLHRLAASLPLRARHLLFRSLHARLGGRLRLFSTGGAPLEPDLARYWERLGIPIVQGYGMTEAAPAVTGTGLRDRRIGSVGKALPGQQVRIAEDDEILAAGPNIMAGYWRDPAATAAAFADGWYRTGDLGHLDQDGYLYLKGRKKDMIVLASGLNVHATDVERELLAEPDIRSAAVLDMLDSEGETRVHAVLVGPASEADTAAAVRQANARLLPHQRVHGWSLWPGEELPQTPALKIKKHEIRAWLQQQQAATTIPTTAADDSSAIARVVALVAHTDSGRVTDTACLGDDLGLDSLGRVELLVALESELGLTLDEEAVSATTTVGDLAQLAHAAGPPPQMAVPSWPRAPWCGRLRQALQAVLIFPLVHAFCRLEVHGEEHLRGLAGPVIVTANHSSHLDSPVVLAALPGSVRRRLAVAAASDYFFEQRWLAVAVGVLLNAFPFARHGAVRATLGGCRTLVGEGWGLLVYPEGTRSLDGEIGSFRTGVGLLAVELGTPVVPVRLRGLEHVLPKGSRRPRRGKVTVTFGEPLRFTQETSAHGAACAIEAAVRAL